MKERQKTTIELDAALWRRAKIRALETGQDLRDVIALALERYLEVEPAAKETVHR